MSAARAAVAGQTDALTDRVNEWVSKALTRAKVRPVEDTDVFLATLPPFRRFAVTGASESLALDFLGASLRDFARLELNNGHDLPTWESPIPEVTEGMKGLVRLSSLRRELKNRAGQWGAERCHLPAGALERCLVEIDQLVTRHAMQMNGTPPPKT